MTTLVTDSGGGGLLWRGLALTRYGTDRNLDDEGLWIHLRDEDSGTSWLATSAQGRTTYAAHAIELHRRDQEISTRVEITVAPVDDVEVRRITLHNESDRVRRLSVTSAGEPVLLPAQQALGHPAFTKLFVESEASSELEGLIFTRRARSATDDHAVLVHRLVREGPAVSYSGYESDRAAFFGRAEGPPAESTPSGGVRARSLRRGPRPRDEPHRVRRAEAEGERDPRLRHGGRAIAQRGRRARAALRLDARGPLGVPRRRPGERPAAEAHRRRRGPAAERAASVSNT